MDAKTKREQIILAASGESRRKSGGAPPQSKTQATTHDCRKKSRALFGRGSWLDS
jgi:hypothetical protein